MAYSRKLSLLFATAVLLALSGCKIVSDKDLAADTSTSEGSFDAVAYVDKIWDAKVVPSFAEHATGLADLLPAIAADPEAAGKAHGRHGGAGDPYSYAVSGTGKVVAVDSKSRRGLVTVDLGGVQAPHQAVLQIGPVVFGSALRDSLPFIQFGDFVNQIQYAQVSRALNDRAIKGVRAGLDPDALMGKTVSFAGGATIRSADEPVTVTPTMLKVASGGGS
jgi:predicted lipoprotein